MVPGESIVVFLIEYLKSSLNVFSVLHRLPGGLTGGVAPNKRHRNRPLDLCSLQLAQDEGSPVRGFGVVEYESAEQAEAMLIEMDRTLVGGQEVRMSLCTPGTSGRSTLAALIAAQGMVSRKPRSSSR